MWNDLDTPRQKFDIDERIGGWKEDVNAFEPQSLKVNQLFT